MVMDPGIDHEGEVPHAGVSLGRRGSDMRMDNSLSMPQFHLIKDQEEPRLSEVIHPS
jgi:hypothetical protein